MNLIEAKLTLILDAYQQLVRSLLRRFDIEGDAKERDKLITRVYHIIEAIEAIK